MKKILGFLFAAVLLTTVTGCIKISIEDGSAGTGDAMNSVFTGETENVVMETGTMPTGIENNIGITVVESESTGNIKNDSGFFSTKSDIVEIQRKKTNSEKNVYISYSGEENIGQITKQIFIYNERFDSENRLFTTPVVEVYKTRDIQKVIKSLGISGCDAKLEGETYFLRPTGAYKSFLETHILYTGDITTELSLHESQDGGRYVCGTKYAFGLIGNILIWQMNFKDGGDDMGLEITNVIIQVPNKE